MDKDGDQSYEALMAIEGINDLTVDLALEKIGQLIDLSDDLGQSDGIERALEWCDALESRGIPDPHIALLEYFRANAWGSRQQKRHADRSVAWAWEQPELQRQVLHLRRAIRNPGFAKLSALRQCQVFTNLGNQLDIVGRFVEALEYWDRALEIEPRFGMALGNRGNGLAHYARALYDGGHRAVFLKFAHDDFSAAGEPLAQYESAGYAEAVSAFKERKASIEAAVDPELLSRSVDLDGHDLGRSQEERRYRNWCLANRLFLNPLNDLGKHAIAAHDVLTLPSFVTTIDGPPTLFGFYNQMKQEFASVRYLYFQGVTTEKVHFSDRGVLLYNTLDYPIYSLAIEKVKAAYRASYSLFDKIAFFLNSYMNLGMPPRKTDFRNIWYAKDTAGKRAIRQEFEQSENWPLRGLFWLSKDLFEEDFRDVTEPDAQALHEIRNHLEHRYLKVHDVLFGPPGRELARSAALADTLACSVPRDDFEAKTLRLLKLARAALIYLSLGMHLEERRREKRRNGGLIVPMDLDVWEDDWKR